MSQIINVNDAEFEAEVLQADKPVLVDFWAEWCSPCKMIAPIIDELATELADKVKFVKMNVDGNEVPVQQRVRGIPALYLFANGELVAKTQGALPKERILAFIEENI